MVEQIKEDKELENYFLNYIKHHLLKNELPDEMPSQEDEEKVTNYLKITYDFKKSVEELIDRLKSKYQLPEDIGHENSRMNKILVEVCEYYYSKYGENYIKRYQPG